MGRNVDRPAAPFGAAGLCRADRGRLTLVVLSCVRGACGSRACCAVSVDGVSTGYLGVWSPTLRRPHRPRRAQVQEFRWDGATGLPGLRRRPLPGEAPGLACGWLRRAGRRAQVCARREP